MKHFETYQEQGLVEPIRIRSAKWVAFLRAFAALAIVFSLFFIFFFIKEGEKLKAAYLSILSSLSLIAVALLVMSFILKVVLHKSLSSRLKKLLLPYMLILDDQGLFTKKYNLKFAWEDINEFTVKQINPMPFASNLFLEVDNYEDYLKRMSSCSRWWYQMYNTRIGRNLCRVLMILSDLNPQSTVSQSVQSDYYQNLIQEMEQFNFYISLSGLSKIKPEEVKQVIENETNKYNSSINE